MRLATCVVAEMAVGVTLIGAATSGVVWGIGQVQPVVEERLAEDPAGADLLDPAPASAAREMRSEGLVAEPAARPEDEPGTTFASPTEHRLAQSAGKPDAELLAPIRDAAIARVKIGSCCTSLNMRIDFDSGARAAFKPEQRNLGSMPRKEIAAYRIDRLLGIGAVPPALGRRFRVEDLEAHLMPESLREKGRLRTEMVSEAGEVNGELSWWIPDLSQPKLDGHRIDTAEGVARWQHLLTVGRDIPDRDQAIAAQISRVVLFDFFINNIDRWSGSNILASADGTVLYFMDNTMSFRPQPRGHSKVRTYIRRCQKFSRALVAALREVSVEEVRGAVARDPGPFPSLLTDPEIDAMMARRDAILAYIDGLIARHGEDAVLVFP